MRLPQDIRDLARRVASGGAGSLRTEPAAVPLLAAALARTTGKRLIVVAATRARMESLQVEIEALMPGQSVGMPPWLASPYVVAQGDRTAEATRLGALTRFLQEPGATRCLLLTAWEWMRRQPAPSLLDSRSMLLITGELVDRTELIEGVIALGYGRVEAVEEPGQIAVRGGILDIFPAGARLPVRVDLFGDEIDSLEHFDPDTQRNGEVLDLAVVPPARLIPLDQGTVGRLRDELRALAGELRYPSRLLSDLLRNLQDGQRPPELEVLYPLGVPLDATVSAYGDDAIVLFDDLGEVRGEITALWDAEWERYHSARSAGALVIPPDRLYRAPEEAWDLGLLPRCIELGRLAGVDTEVDGAPLREGALDSGAEPIFLPGDGAQGRSALFAQEARRWLDEGLHVVVLCEGAESQERIRRILGAHGLGAIVHEKPWSLEWLKGLRPALKVRLALGTVARGFVARPLGLVVVGEVDLFGKRPEVRRSPRRRISDAVRVLSSLEEGDFVVHSQYGIGRFLGLETKAAGGHEASFLALEYAEGSRLFVPVHHADRIQRYIGSDTKKASVDKLGGVTWEKRKSKARDAAKKLAFDLVKVYAKRSARPGYAFSPADEYFEEFEAAFPHQETTDQASAIRDVLDDMERPRPMDRLVCGDVGFGKTEVAIRAAFKVVLDGKQAAVLVPTTILAEQHRRTFEERLRDYPVRVESLSRFKTPARQKAVLKDVAAGQVDILVGTHRLLGKDVAFKSLGLLVVDEEHRFGVGHKETIKAARETVDVLSMTATPIPRTLHMAMAGIRDISVIASAPVGRRSVETQVIRWEDKTVARAIRRELERDGQVFVLHNAVKDLGTLAEQMGRLVPEVRLGVAHGQMSEGKLEKAMLDFGAGRYNVLLCTTIIESGLDLPRVNTLIVNNAHRFGLAQLHQIRGRVGRSERQAYAYFIVPPLHSMTQEARQRLAALQRYTDLGAGFSVATMDLEIRGAGEIFGANQSGQMAAVGYELFTAMLEDAVKELRGDEEATEVDPEIRVPVAAHVPEDYLPDRHARLVLYRRVAACRTREELAALAAETEARYGHFPQAMNDLFSLVGLKVRCREAGIALLDVASQKVRLDLAQATADLQDRVLVLLRDPPVQVRMDPKGLLELNMKGKATGPLGLAEAALDLLD